MAQKKLLVVYNTCGISKNEKFDWYRQCLDSIYQQDMSGFDVAISACMNSDETQQQLLDRYANATSCVTYFNFIDERLTVNTTFNHTVQKCFEHNEYEAVIYIDSGVTLAGNNQLLKIMYDKFKSGPYGMVTIQTDNDMGMDRHIFGEDYIFPVGNACNLHLQLFDSLLYHKYDKKILPDVFVAYCSESTFSFLNAAIDRKWILVKDLIAIHNKGVDGATSGFGHMGPHGVPWNNLFNNRNALDFINDPECKEAGMGYEECGRIMMHNPNAFDPNGFAKSKKLLQLIKKYWFLTNAELDYSKVNHSFHVA